jgi:prevent-host-death family protein
MVTTSRYPGAVDVGIRELKAHLSEYVERARGGTEVVVTDRGRPVARLVPFSGRSAVEAGIDDGWIDPPRRQGLPAVDRARSPLRTTDVLEDDRG